MTVTVSPALNAGLNSVKAISKTITPGINGANGNLNRKVGLATLLAAFNAPQMRDRLEQAYVTQISRSNGTFPSVPRTYAIVINVPKVHIVATDDPALADPTHTDNVEETTSPVDPTEDAPVKKSKVKAPRQFFKVVESTRETLIADKMVALDENGQPENEDVFAELVGREDVAVGVFWAAGVLSGLKTGEYTTTAAVIAFNKAGFTFLNEGVEWKPPIIGKSGASTKSPGAPVPVGVTAQASQGDETPVNADAQPDADVPQESDENAAMRNGSSRRKQAVPA